MLHDSFKSCYKYPFGAQTTNTKINLCIDVPHSVGTVTIRLWYSDGGEVLVPMHQCQNYKNDSLQRMEGAFFTNSVPGYVWYYFIIEEKNNNIVNRYYYGDNHDHLGGQGQIYQENPISYQITVYDENNKFPQWTNDSVLYHIFVDRFYRGKISPPLGQGLKNNQLIHPNWNDQPMYCKDSNGDVLQYDFFGGNLQGILEKLEYLNDLGVNLIYLSPIMDSVSNHKYDIGDYKKIDAAFGDNNDFKRLIAKAHSYGMKVILDGVFSHTGADSIYFNKFNNYDSLGAYQDKNSPFYSWYNFKEFPDQYDCWWGMTNLPNVNEETKSYMDYIIHNWDSVIHHWHSLGIDGWRLDVADELPINFLKAFYAEVKKLYPQALIIGEVWEDATQKEVDGHLRHYAQGHMLDSVMNYPFRNIVIDTLTENISPKEGLHRLASLYENYPKQMAHSLMNLLSSHDEIRILTALANPPDMSNWTMSQRMNYKLSDKQLKKALKRLFLAILWQCTVIGMPSIYYGDEIGLEGDKDPLNRRPFNWDNPNEDIFNWYKKLLKLRKKLAVLRHGHFESLNINQLIAYKRMFTQDQVINNEDFDNSLAYVLINPTTEKITTNLLLPNIDGSWQGLSTKTGKFYLFDLDNEPLVKENINSCEIILEPLEGLIIYTQAGDFIYKPQDIKKESSITKKTTNESLDSNSNTTKENESLLTAIELANKKNLEKPTNYDQEKNTEDTAQYGVLLHITSLPNKNGIGDMGPNAYHWLDILAYNKQKYWQILPLTEPALGNSPYTACSLIAGDTRILSLEYFAKQNFLTLDEINASNQALNEYGPIDVEKMEIHKIPLYRQAWRRFLHNKDAQQEYKEFCANETSWLDDYALFQALKQKFANLHWHQWGKFKDYDYAKRNAKLFANEMEYIKFLQWQFFKQWDNLHNYAKQKGISIIGDVPFFVAEDSVEVWSKGEYFLLNEEKYPITVAGVPPDYFAKDGQNWGNPQYNWAVLEKENYAWWIEQIKQVFRKVDIVRFDHFRGYEATWHIPYGEKTASKGQWVKGPGIKLFKALAEAIPAYKEQLEGSDNIVAIAEDLGVITDYVRKLMKKSNLPGMNVLPFVIGNNFNDFKDINERIFYTGTHDNDTLLGWIKELQLAEKQRLDNNLMELCKFLGLPKNTPAKKIYHELLIWALKVKSKITIIPMQDIVGLDSNHRMNIPGTVNEKNWLWRLPPSDFF